MAQVTKLQPVKDYVDIERIYLHDSIADIANSKTLSKDTVPGARMVYYKGSPVVEIEYKNKTFTVPITNVKAMLLK